MAQELKKRNEMDPRYQWKLTDIYADDQAFENDFAKIQEYVKEFARFQGHVAEDPKAAIRESFRVMRMLDKLYGFAFMKQDEDRGNNVYQALAARSMSLIVEAQSAAAFLEPELLAMPEEELLKLADDPDMADYDVYIKEILRRKPHTLDAAQEKHICI